MTHEASTAGSQPTQLISDDIVHGIDQETGAWLGDMARGMDLRRISLAYMHWMAHLSTAPGKTAQLAESWFQHNARFGQFALRSLVDKAPERAFDPEDGDQRFQDASWRRLPFSLFEQYYLMQRQWWDQATTQVSGLSERNENLVNFFTRMTIDTLSPSNFPTTNPEVLNTTYREWGRNLLRGTRNLGRDIHRKNRGLPPKSLDQFRVGRNMAITPGKVVYRNHLIELIQYEPTTDQVHPEPVLLVPAWIMKYYILDLSAGRSLVHYLLDQGHTVFIISWRNPDQGDRDLSMDDYSRLGPLAALDAINEIVPEQPVHAMGYCVGGTLMAITAAAMARDHDERLATLTLLAAQTDFSEPGELRLFINNSQLSWLDSLMWKKGYLDKEKMAGAFMLLRANELLWQPAIHNYWLGKESPGIDLMAWNADATRLPYRMHSEYLSQLYLQNALAAGQYEVEGKPIALNDIRVPLFTVGTEKDHIAPWRSVYKIGMLAGSDEQTFLLTSGGHNAGIITPPDHPRRHYRMATRDRDYPFISAQEWLSTHEPIQGSWWPAWQQWLASHSGAKVKPPSMGPALIDAPGTYVHQQ